MRQREIFTSFAFFLILGLFIQPVVLVADLYSQESTERQVQERIVERRMVQALLDTASSTKSSYLSTIIEEKRLAAIAQVRSGESIRYEVSDRSIEGGIYRIGIRERGMGYQANASWKALETGGEIEIWSREQYHKGLRQIVLSAISRKDDLIFEARFEYGSIDYGLSDVRNRLRNLIANAEAQRLFDKALRSKDFSIYLPFVGEWKGPMRNTKGSSIKESSLTLNVDERQGLVGKWHNEWEVQSVEYVNRNILIWKHENIAGCREYQNRFVIDAEDSKKAMLHYDVRDRCAGEEIYSGIHILRRK